MSMVADVFVGLYYNAYGLVINAIQKPVYVKITTIQTAKNVLKQNGASVFFTPSD